MYSVNNLKSDEKHSDNDDTISIADKDRIILIKFGGNAMKDDKIKVNVIENICRLKQQGYKVVLVHGGGPAIKEMLSMAGKESEFVGGHRKTDEESIGYVEMALKGQVNGELVKLINSKGEQAVGLSGKDGTTVQALKRYHKEKKKGKVKVIDLGQVGDVEVIDPSLIELLIDNDYIPVIAPIGCGEDFQDYNINADMFAGHMAAALDAGHFVVLTDVDGLMKDKDDPNTLIKEISREEVKNEIGGIVQGGMIPKTESCIAALEGGVAHAYIINGMKKDILTEVFTEKKFKGTIIKN